LEELARTMLNKIVLLKYFSTDVLSTTCYALIKVLIKPIMKLIPYEPFKDREQNIFHLTIFGCKCCLK